MTQPHPFEQKMLDLVNSFPTLRGKFTRWDALEFEEWFSGEPSSGMKHAARFILEVWSPYDEWKCGRFDWMGGRFDWMGAIGVWDHHRKAFIAWLQDPFYP